MPAPIPVAHNTEPTNSNKQYTEPCMNTYPSSRLERPCAKVSRWTHPSALTGLDVKCHESLESRAAPSKRPREDPSGAPLPASDLARIPPASDFLRCSSEQSPPPTIKTNAQPTPDSSRREEGEELKAPLYRALHKAPPPCKKQQLPVWLRLSQDCSAE